MPATAVSPMHCKSSLDGRHFKNLDKNEHKKFNVRLEVSMSYIQNVFGRHSSPHLKHASDSAEFTEYT